MTQDQVGIRLATFTAVTLLIVKFIVGILSGSVAVLSSAIDSMLDMFVSIFNYIALKNSLKPADEKFNYGRGKIEALAAFLEGLIITFSGLYILYESVLKIINKGEVTNIGPAVYVMVFSVILTSILVFVLHRIYKKTGNLVLESDALHYKTDLYTNVGVLLSLLVIYYTKLYFIDGLVGIAISFYIIISAFFILKKGFLMILDESLEEEYVSKIKNIITSHNEISSFHFLKTRKASKTYFVQAHLVYKNKSIELIEAHRVSERIECEIVALNKEKDWVIDFHLDPYDDKDFDEGNRICNI